MKTGDRQLAGWVKNPGANAEITIRNDVPIPKPAEDQVLIKLECTGIWCAYLSFFCSHLDIRSNIYRAVLNCLKGTNLEHMQATLTLIESMMTSR